MKDRTAIRFIGSGSRLTTRRIESELQKLAIPTIPDEYRVFLLKHNGGKPEPGCFLFPQDSTPDVDWVVSFCPITSSDIDTLSFRGWNTRLALYAMHFGVPRDCISIGADGGENDILLFVRGSRRNQLWIKVWDETECKLDLKRDTDPELGMHFLANSLGEFLEMLCTEEEADRRVAEYAAQQRKRPAKKKSRPSSGRTRSK